MSAAPAGKSKSPYIGERRAKPIKGAPLRSGIVLNVLFNGVENCFNLSPRISTGEQTGIFDCSHFPDFVQNQKSENFFHAFFDSGFALGKIEKEKSFQNHLHV